MSRTLIVTGARKGIGRALAQRLTQDGHCAVGLTRGFPPELPGKLARIDFLGNEPEACDLADLAECSPFNGIVSNTGLVHEQRRV